MLEDRYFKILIVLLKAVFERHAAVQQNIKRTHGMPNFFEKLNRKYIFVSKVFEKWVKILTNCASCAQFWARLAQTSPSIPLFAVAR